MPCLLCGSAAAARKRVRCRNSLKKILWLAATSGAVFALCGAVREKIISCFSPYQAYPFGGKFLQIRLVFNRGTAFGFWQQREELVVALAALCSLALGIWLVRKSKEMQVWELLSFSFIFGGALANLWERVFLGYVVDYLDLGFWPVFNLADSFISAGCILLAVRYFYKR